MRVKRKFAQITSLVASGVMALAGCSGQPDEARSYLALAQEAFTQGRFERAFEHYREVTLLVPNTEYDARARFEMASIAYLRWRDVIEARVRLRTLIRDIPKSGRDIDARLLLARIHAEEMNQTHKALREYLSLTTERGDELSDEQRARANLGIARLQEGFGYLEKAQSAYELVWNMEDINRRTHDEATDALTHLANLQGDLEHARMLLHERLEQVSKPASRLEVLCRLIDTELGSDDYARAAQSLQLAEAEFPNELRIQNRRTHLSEIIDQQPQAITARELKRLQDRIPWSVGRRATPARAARSVTQP